MLPVEILVDAQTPGDAIVRGHVRRVAGVHGAVAPAGPSWHRDGTRDRRWPSPIPERRLADRAHD